MRVKVCGITRYEDARLALDAGAWAIGLVFHPPSPRYLSPESAAELLRRLPPETLAVGVFVDAPLLEVNAAVARIGLRGVQLHGDEPPEYAAAVRAEQVIKAFRVGPGFQVSRIDEYAGRMILLDAYQPGVPGGTGSTFDWSVAREAGRRAPVLLSGGLSSENVAEAVAAAQPAGIDVSSGVESSPGRKDPRKLRRFFEALRAR